MSESTVKLGKYELRRELGRGAMGVVYEAFDPSIERIVALKTIRSDQLESAEGQDVVGRFQREAKAAGRLNHPNIVSIYDFGEDNGTSFIAMEFVSGRELKSYFDNNERFPMADIVRVMSQLLDALEYSHQYGVVHRDIKPANIILLPDGRAKVADFGIARIESSQYTQAGTVLGTPAYMSPEQFMGQTVDGRSDIFSAGVVLYQFLSGERPFSGTATTIMHKVLMEDPLPPSTLNVQVPKPFDAVIKKAMAKRPEERFQTAREFAEAIRAAAAGKAPPDPDATVVATVVNAAATGRSAPPETAAVSSAAPAPRRKAPLPLVAAVLAGVIGIGMAGYFLLPRSKSGDVPVPAAGTPAAAATDTRAPAPVAAAPMEAGVMIISAVGLADPSEQKYQADKSLLSADLRADSRSQLVEKAITLYLDRASFAKNYDRLRDRLLSRSGDYIASIVQEGEPQRSNDGLMYVTTQAAVKVREVQKSLNQLSRDERIDFIRNNGDPKISVTISVRGENSDAPAQNSQVAENLLKARIKSFGFRIWSDDPKLPAPRGNGAEFAVVGEAKLKKLSARLAASGITVEKYVLTSWTVKCVDKLSGEEIYYNNKLPLATGSWASEEQALAAIGGKIADEFSRDFFVQHFHASERKVTLKIDGLPDQSVENAIARELVGLQPVIGVTRRAGGASAVYELQLSGGTGPLGDLVDGAVLKPLNAKLGRACFNLGASVGEQISVAFDKACSDKAVLARLEANPPASLYAAPSARQKSVLKDPNAIRKLSI
ncbi:MAG: cag pathogenicity island protein Cag6 [Betaproteobacteria bacterium RIFCSPLOWO2_12_FULL_64_23]|nr:MAG: cag pathogenicity island protein Cag6 [Betaproteobacteria bacterium RIFCSPLOWO2_12_FULL_64_23]